MLYKFSDFNKQNLDSISNNSFFFSQKEQLNDPLDCDPPILFPDYFRFQGLFKNMLNRLTNCSVDFVDFMQKEEVLGFLYSIFRDTDEFKNILTRQASHVGMLCLSRDFDNPLMWGHYANGHRGFCAGYNIEADDVMMWTEVDLFDDELVVMKNIEYSSDPIDAALVYIRLVHLMLQKSRDANGFLNFEPAFDVCSFKNISRMTIRYLTVFFLSHKDKHWSYEREVRLLAMPNKNGNSSGLKQSKSNLLSDVYFGAKMPTSEKIILTKLLSANGTKFYECYFSNSSKNISFRSVSYK
jgi:hypothetical protein